MRVAIIHYWFVQERGGEKVVRNLCDLFPQAVLFTHVSDPELTARMFPGHEVRHSFIARLPGAKRHYQKYLPLMPIALEHLDLSEFDLIISSESGPAKGVIPPPNAVHICYCHSPMRYIWDKYHLYRNRAGWIERAVMPFVASAMRQWDVSCAARVDHFIANSKFVAQRIRKYYRRDADVVYPPVEIDKFAANGAVTKRDDFAGCYLWVGQLTAYKHPDVAIDAITRLNRRLVIIGDGEMAKKLRAGAGDNVVFLGRASDDTIKQAYASCRALVFPGEEDFGIVPVEAMASGLPVIALKRGGALETVADGETGVLFESPTADSLAKAIERFETLEKSFDPAHISQHARNFSPDIFKQSISQIVQSAMHQNR